MCWRKKVLSLIFLAFIISLKNSFGADEDEIKLGYYTDRVFLYNETILMDEELTNRIADVGNRIVQASDRTDLKYTYRVINDSNINAFSCSGGFVYVNTGLLDIIENEDELACVLAHEIHHVNAKHIIKSIYAQERSIVAGQIAGGLMGVFIGIGLSAPVMGMGMPTFPMALSQSMMNLGQIMGAELGNQIAMSMIKGYGRKQELEADAFAVKYVQKAGYNPNAMITFFKKLISVRDKLGINEKNYVSNLINCEPGLEERIKHVEVALSNTDKKN